MLHWFHLGRCEVPWRELEGVTPCRASVLVSTAERDGECVGDVAVPIHSGEKVFDVKGRPKLDKMELQYHAMCIQLMKSQLSIWVMLVVSFPLFATLSH